MSQNNYGLPFPLTAQSIFDKVAAHLLRQGFKSLRDTKRFFCGYRGSKGGACAVGVLISDEVYDPAFEGAAAYSIAGPLVPELEDYRSLLQSLQDAHDDTRCDQDGIFDRAELIAALRARAVKYRLSTVILDASVDNQPWIAPQAVEIIPTALPAEITRLLAPEAAVVTEGV